MLKPLIHRLALVLVVCGGAWFSAPAAASQPADWDCRGSANWSFCPGAARFQTFKQTIARAVDGDRLQIGNPQNEMLPTGFHVNAGAQLRVNVKRVAGQDLPILVVGTPHRDALRTSRTFFQLREGENLIDARTGGVDLEGNPFIDDLGGTVYVMYTSTNPTASARIEFARGFMRIPYFVRGKTHKLLYRAMLKLYKDVPDVMLVSKRAMVTMSQAKANEFAEFDQDLTMDLYEHIIAEEEAISGIDGSAPEHAPRVNRWLVTERASGSPASAPGAIQIPASLMHRAIDPLQLGGIGGWMMWHEFGHTHQQFWTWTPLGETTVNIYSMAVERSLGLPSRLVTDNIWPRVDTYLALPDAERNFNTTNVNHYVRMAMLHQLWLAFGDDLYRDLHKKMRIERPVFEAGAVGTAAKMRWFALNASTLSGRNLNDFFRRWGVPLGTDVVAEIDALGLPAPDQDLTQLRDP